MINNLIVSKAANLAFEAANSERVFVIIENEIKSCREYVFVESNFLTIFGE